MFWLTSFGCIFWWRIYYHSFIQHTITNKLNILLDLFHEKIFFLTLSGVFCKSTFLSEQIWFKLTDSVCSVNILAAVDYGLDCPSHELAYSIAFSFPATFHVISRNFVWFEIGHDMYSIKRFNILKSYKSANLPLGKNACKQYG